MTWLSTLGSRIKLQFCLEWRELFLSDPEQLVRLQAQAPLRMLKTIAQGKLGILLLLRPIHRLQEKIPEVEPLEFHWIGSLLRIDQLQLVS